jgi:hypothetical protein
MVKNHYSALPVDVAALSDNFLQIEKEIVDLLHLERIFMPLDLHSFLRNPEEGLMRVLYTRLFDVLQGKMSLDEFEKQAAGELQAGASYLFRLGYEWWTALVLIKLLDPDEAFGVDLNEDNKPVLMEMKEICFGRQAHHPTIRIPEFVIHSRKIDRYVAIKMALAREVDTFVVPFKPPVRPRKKTGDTSFALDSRVMLLFFMQSTETVPVLADIYECTLTRPQWMVEYITGGEFTDANALEEVQRHLDALKPELGTCLVLVNAEDEAGLGDVPESIRPVAAGFDQSKLQAVVEELPRES